MDKYIGKSVLKGVAVGRVFWYKKQDYHIEKQTVSDIEAEKTRVHEAVEAAKEQLTALYDKALANVGEDHAAIFDIHRMMLAMRGRMRSMPWRRHRISLRSCLPPWMTSI